MKMNLIGKVSIVVTFLAVLLLSLTGSTSDTTITDEEQHANFLKNYAVYALPLPEHMEFAGEPVPLNDPDVRERLDRELLVNTYWQSNTLLLIKRSARWIPEMKAIFREEDVPEDFAYLGLIESGYQNVISPAGATGYWQFLESTAREYGLEINSEIDERYHPLKSTRAAAQYLKWAHDRFGSWTMAAASYNMGRSGLIRQIDRQEADYYYDLLLNSETARYVFRILAIKEIIEDPAKYGFNVRLADLYQPIETETVIIDGPVESFPAFAEEHGINYKTLKYHNPWLRENFLTNSAGKEYEIEIPVDKSFISPE